MTEITLEMTEEINDRVEALSRSRGYDVGEIFRLGLCLLDVADEALREGNVLMVAKELPGDGYEPVAVLTEIF